MKETNTQYRCSGCGMAFRFREKPHFCPKCGSPAVEKDNAAAREHGEKMIAALKYLAPQLEIAFENYVQVEAQYQVLMASVRKYVSRGIIDPKDVPQIQKKTIREAMADYRRRMKEQKGDPDEDRHTED